MIHSCSLRDYQEHALITEQNCGIFYYGALENMEDDKRVEPGGFRAPAASLPPQQRREDCLSYAASFKLCFLLFQIKHISFEVAVAFGKVDAVDKVDGKADTCFNFFPFQSILFLFLLLNNYTWIKFN